MLSHTLIRRLFSGAELLLFAGVLAVTVLHSSAAEWQPTSLVVLLLALALLGQWLSVEITAGQLSASLVAIVLAMSLLGPAPAVACGVAAMILASATRRLALADWLINLSTFGAISLTGGLLVRLLGTELHVLRGHHVVDSTAFGLIVLVVFVTILALSFLLFALGAAVQERHSVLRELRDLMPLLPGELATGALAAILAVGYTAVGIAILLASIALLVIFRQLTVALLRSEDRAEQLYARSRQLVGLQLGVLRTLLHALSMRDETTARHAAAVARYAKALSVELGCSEEEGDVVHTAGLLHEIGKFTWPDRILHADVVAKEDLGIVKDHPQEGAVLVGALDGYGPVADAILYHHERVDGGGYPAGLIGKEIPLASRILAICATYDTITARGSYRPPMTPQEAMDELRNAARNGQLDGEIVESFIAVLLREGEMFARDADFETELEFERRARAMVEPRSVTGSGTGADDGGSWRSSLASLIPSRH
jgi:HD-GYP domain-containing protein (c-di-GMP phosphodiesterase class II)